MGQRGFITPTAVYLGSVLVGSAILTAPTVTPLALAILLGAGGTGGAIYGIIVATRVWQMNLDLADRACYVVIPILAYAAIALAAVLENWAVAWTFDTLAAALVVILIVGMRNAWDMATFMIAKKDQR